MWENSGSVIIEALECRELMSATMHVAAKKAPVKLNKPAAIHVAAKPAAKVAAKSAAKKSAAAATTVVPDSRITANAPSIVGDWSGTMTPDGATTGSDFSIHFAFQRDISASGTFDLGPVMGNQSAVSTLTFSGRKNFRVLISTPNLLAGFNGTITSDLKTLWGRYSFNTPEGYKTGMFSLTRG